MQEDEAMRTFLSRACAVLALPLLLLAPACGRKIRQSALDPLTASEAGSFRFDRELGCRSASVKPFRVLSDRPARGIIVVSGCGRDAVYGEGHPGAAFRLDADPEVETDPALQEEYAMSCPGIRKVLGEYGVVAAQEYWARAVTLPSRWNSPFTSEPELDEMAFEKLIAGEIVSRPADTLNRHFGPMLATALRHPGSGDWAPSTTLDLRQVRIRWPVRSPEAATLCARVDSPSGRAVHYLCMSYTPDNRFEDFGTC